MIEEIELTDGEREPLMRTMSCPVPQAPRSAGAEPSPAQILIPPIFFSWGYAGVEATQTTQYFLINGQGSNAGPNNTVPMIARKELILRVYPRRGFLSSPAQVTGVVTCPGKPNLTPINGPVAVQSTNAIQRGNASHSLNFRVPASYCVGTVTFAVKLTDSANAANFRTRNVTLNFASVPQVRVHGVLIHYTGKGLNIAAPTGIDLINTLAWVARTYPVSGFNYTACQVVDFNGDLTVGGGGGCGTGWNQLFSMLWNMRAASTPDASGNRDLFVALLPAGVPTSGVIGCGGSGVAIAYNGGGSVLAQEMAHAFGRAHAPCGNPGGPDPSYPTYASYPSGSIGEFGVDTSNMQISDPAATYDFMSYCGPVWVSPYTYVALKNAIVTGTGGAPAHADRAGSRHTADEYLFLNFRMHRGGKVELMNSFHLATDQPPVEEGKPTNVGCDLLDKHGEVIESHRCRLVDPHTDEDEGQVELHEVVPWSDDIHTVAFTRDGKVCHKIEVEGRAPEVEFTGLKQVERRANLLRLEWSVKHGKAAKPAARAMSHILRYSNDDGATWRAVAADLADTRHVVNLEALPGGERCRFQVITSSGIRTSVVTSEPLAVPRKPHTAYILSPVKSGMSSKQGEGLVLLGGGFSPDFGTTDFDEVVWTSDRDGLIGTGYQVITHSLSLGRHRISIHLPDGLGGEATASVFVNVT